MTTDRISLGEILHRARQALGEQRPRPWPIEDWKDRGPQLQAGDEAMAGAVEAEVRRRVVAEIRGHASVWPPGFQRNLVHSVADAVVRDGKDRSDEKEAGHGQH